MSSSESSSTSNNDGTNTTSLVIGMGGSFHNPQFIWTHGDPNDDAQLEDPPLAKLQAQPNTSKKNCTPKRIGISIGTVLCLCCIIIVVVWQTQWNGSNFDFTHEQSDWPQISPEDHAAALPNAWYSTGNANMDSGTDNNNNPSNAKTSNKTPLPAALNYSVLIQPVVFHVIYKTDGVTGMIPITTLQKQIDQLNRAFRGVEARVSRYHAPTDAGIQFTLHAVDYTANDDWFEMCALYNYQGIVKPALALNPAIYYNVYICNVAASLGLSWLPYQSFRYQGKTVMPTESHWMLGSLVDWQLLPGNNIFGGRWIQGDILTHETGHQMGLMHIYQGGCILTEAYSDQILDTPRQNGNPSGTCAQLAGLDSCPQQPGKDDNSNYMGIAADSCRSHFTPGQVAYMRGVIETLKPTLQAQQFQVGCVSAVDSTDASPDLAPCVQVYPGDAKTGARAWCTTNKTDSSVWGWACCPGDDQSCRDLTGFSLTVNSDATPSSRNAALATTSTNGDDGSCTNWFGINDAGDVEPCQLPFTLLVGQNQKQFTQPVFRNMSSVVPFGWQARIQALPNVMIGDPPQPIGDLGGAPYRWCPFVAHYSGDGSNSARWGLSLCV